FQTTKNYSFFKKEEYKLAIIQHLLGANIKYGLRRADKVIVQTEWMKEAIIKQTNTEAKSIEVIPPSIKVGERIKKNNTKYNYNHFFYPGASSTYKNNNLINQACEYIDYKYPGLQYKVDITVDEKFNNKHIRSIGKIPREKVFEKMTNEVL